MPGLKCIIVIMAVARTKINDILLYDYCFPILVFMIWLYTRLYGILYWWRLQRNSLLQVPMVTRICSFSIVVYCGLWYGVLMSSWHSQGRFFSCGSRGELFPLKNSVITCVGFIGNLLTELDELVPLLMQSQLLTVRICVCRCMAPADKKVIQLNQWTLFVQKGHEW